jgi:hypothetical protein
LASNERVELTQMARFATLVLALMAATATWLTLAATPTGAAPSVRYGLTDDAWLLHGPGSVEQRVARLSSLGVRVVRFTVRWDQVAATKPATPANPADEAYDWSEPDSVLLALRAGGIQPLVQIVGTPPWANGGKPSNYAPTSTASFRDFATAAGRHYRWVKRWLIWNEPNQVRWLRPTSAAVYTTRLLNPAYAALHRTVPGVQVGGGGTAPRGSIGGISPITWLRAMHAAHARLDAYAHNPYPLDPKRETPLSGGCAHCATLTMATIDRLVSLVTSNFPHARIWLSEYGYQTDPPDRLLGVSPAHQAEYSSEGAYVAYRTPRVDVLIHFLYRDEPNVARFQSGLVSLTNASKPVLAAYQLPLAQIARKGTRVTLWGQARAPGTSTTVRIEQRTGAAWRTVATVHAGTGRFFRWSGTLARGAQVRAHAGSVVGATLTIA